MEPCETGLQHRLLDNYGQALEVALIYRAEGTPHLQFDVHPCPRALIYVRQRRNRGDLGSNKPDDFRHHPASTTDSKRFPHRPAHIHSKHRRSHDR
jgi:hypothetical protein